MKHSLYKYREIMLVVGILGLIILPLFFILTDLDLWLRCLVLAIAILFIVIGLIYSIFIIKSEKEEKNDKINYIKVKNVRYKYIKQHDYRRFETKIIGYKFYYNGKCYIYMSNRDEKLDSHISKIYGFEYYKTFKIIKNVKYNN